MKHDKNDLLRRQDCIEAIEEITCSMSLCVNADECHGMQRMRKQAVIELANMPAVHPNHIADIGKKGCVDAISRQAAVELAMKYCPDDDGAVQCDGDIRGLLDELENLSSAQPNLQPTCNQLATDTISRQAAIEAIDAACVKYDISPHYDDKRSDKEKFFDWWDMYKVLSMKILNNLPSTQPTLCGYNIEHLILIANVLRKENLPPERVVEALTDIGRIVSIVKDEFEESLRREVEQCKV